MMQVTLWKMSQDGTGGEPCGKVTWDGDSLKVDPEERDILEMPVWDEDEDRIVHADEDPEAFLRNLPLLFHGSHFWAELNESDKDEMALDMGWDESKHPRGQPENKGEFGP